MAKASTSKKTAKKAPKKGAKKGAKTKPKSSAASTAKMLKLIQSLDLQVLHLKFKASPPAAAVPLPAPTVGLEKTVALAAVAAAPAAAPAAAEAMAEDLVGGSPSLHADPKLWRRLVQLCLLSIEKDLALNTPASEGLALSKPADLELYVISQEERFDLLDLHDATFQALADAGHALAVNHAKAAATKVDTIAPGDPGADSMLADLRALSDDIRGDQNFSTVLNLLEAATAAYAGTPIPP